MKDEDLIAAIRELGSEAYGVPLRQRLGVSLATLYTRLEELEERGLITHEDKPGGIERSYRPRRVWRVV